MPCFPTTFDDEFTYQSQIDHVPPRVLSLLCLSYQLRKRKTRESTCSYSYMIRTLEGRELTVRTLRGRHNRALEKRAMGFTYCLWVAVTVDICRPTCIFFQVLVSTAPTRIHFVIYDPTLLLVTEYVYSKMPTYMFIYVGS